MIADALRYLTSLAESAATPKPLPSDGRTARFLVGGTVTEIALDPARRDHKPACLADLVALANRFKDQPDADDEDATSRFPVVWYDSDAVVLTINDDYRRDERATLALQVSDLFAVAAGLRKAKAWMDQKAFVRLLKVELAGTMAPSVLLDRVRKLKIENGQTVSSEVSRNKESLGRTIESKVSGEGEIPETVTLEVPVYKTLGETDRYPMLCSVELDPTRTDAFRLMPLPDEIERVQYLAIGSIAERLELGLTEGIPAYHGKP